AGGAVRGAAVDAELPRRRDPRRGRAADRGLRRAHRGRARPLTPHLWGRYNAAAAKRADQAARRACIHKYARRVTSQPTTTGTAAKLADLAERNAELERAESVRSEERRVGREWRSRRRP